MKGMDSALSTARAAPTAAAAPPRSGVCVSVAVYGTNFTFVTSVTLVTFLGWFEAPTGHSSRSSQTSVWIVSFVSFWPSCSTSALRCACYAAADVVVLCSPRQSHKNQKSQFDVCDVCFLGDDLLCA